MIPDAGGDLAGGMCSHPTSATLQYNITGTKPHTADRTARLAGLASEFHTNVSTCVLINWSESRNEDDTA